MSASFFVLGERLNLLQWMGALLALGAVGGICFLRPKEAAEAALFDS